jgi:hypothetical protein
LLPLPCTYPAHLERHGATSFLTTFFSVGHSTCHLNPVAEYMQALAFLSVDSHLTFACHIPCLGCRSLSSSSGTWQTPTCRFFDRDLLSDDHCSEAAYLQVGAPFLLLTSHG